MIRRCLRIGLWIVGALSLVCAVALLWPIRPTIDPIQPRQSTQYWAMEGGYRIAYTHVESTTPPVASPVIYLHGGPGGYVHSSYIDLLGQLASHALSTPKFKSRGATLSLTGSVGLTACVPRMVPVDPADPATDCWVDIDCDVSCSAVAWGVLQCVEVP